MDDWEDGTEEIIEWDDCDETDQALQTLFEPDEFYVDINKD